MVTLNLPDTASVGDSGHTTDHNLIVAALTTVGAQLSALADRVTALETYPLPSAPTVYGTAIAMDAIGNSQIGGTSSGEANTYFAYRFRAEQSSTLTDFRLYWLPAPDPGYSEGTGGTIRMTIETDSGGFPSGTVLATLDYVEPSEVFPLHSFAAPPTLIAGTVYHLVFTNIDAAPTVNFTSVDNAYVANPTTPRQPRWPDADWAGLVKFGSKPWELSPKHTPILDLTYGNGAHQGHSYMEVERPNDCVIAGTNSLVRERFTVSGGSRVVTGASVRIAKTSGTGNLVVRLEDTAGTLIDSFSVSTANVPTITKGVTAVASGVWVSGVFALPRTLTNGVTYNLRLSTDASTALWTRGIQSGEAYGFGAATHYGDGILQVTSDGGSNWAEVSGLEESGDMQFYFTVAGEPAAPTELLTANQQSGTDTLADATGFTGSDSTVASSTVMARTGVRSLEVTATVTNGNANAVLDQVTVVAGQIVRATAWARKGGSVDPGSSRDAVVWVWWFQSGGAPCSHAYDYVAAVNSGTSWVEVSKDFTAPATAAAAVMWVSGSDDTTIAIGDKTYWDDLSLSVQN